jgi:Na+/H+ antiporter NhaD/arsenite permease-like protein
MHETALQTTTDPISQAIVAVLLASLFALLAIEKAHRVLVAMVAVSVLWAITYLTPFHLLSLESATAALDLNVLLLLAAMMALVGVMKETGVFGWAVERLLARFGGDPVQAIAVLWWFTAIASAFVDNVTTVIFVTPVVLAATKRLGAPAMLVIIPTVMAANIGGTATLIGDPPNIMIGSGAGLSFMDFVRELTVPVLVMMCGLHWWGARRLRAVMPGTDGRRQTAGGRFAGDAGHGGDKGGGEVAVITDAGLLRWMGGISVVVLIGFVTHGVTGMPAAVPAVLGAAAALVIQDVRYLRSAKPSHDERRHGILHVLEREIEWPTLTFFAFLFIIVGAAVATGLIGTLASWLQQAIFAGREAFGLGEAGTLLFAALLVMWVSGILSALMDNIPFVAVSIPVIAALIAALPGDGTVLWWALSLGACLGGNGTPIGASANVTTLGLAEREGVRIGFGEFVAVGAKVTLFTLVVATLFLSGFVLLGPTQVTYVGLAVLAASVFGLWVGGKARKRVPVKV